MENILPRREARENAFLLALDHCRQCGQLAVIAVKLQKLCNVHIAHAIAVGHHKRLIPHIRLDTLDASAGHGVQTGIHHCDLPRLGVVIMYGHFILTVGKIKGNVTGVQEVIREPLFDHVLLVPRAHDELVKAIAGVLLHNVPENGHTADLHHGLGPVLGFLTDACTESPGK